MERRQDFDPVDSGVILKGSSREMPARVSGVRAWRLPCDDQPGLDDRNLAQEKRAAGGHFLFQVRGSRPGFHDVGNGACSRFIPMASIILSSSFTGPGKGLASSSAQGLADKHQLRFAAFTEDNICPRPQSLHLRQSPRSLRICSVSADSCITQRSSKRVCQPSGPGAQVEGPGLVSDDRSDR
jgi:hypothetical protein